MQPTESDITVVVGDDHPLMRDAVVRSLAPLDDVRVVACAESATSLIAAVEEHSPDIAVADLRLGDGDAFDVLRATQAGGHATRILILSSFGESALVHRALTEGAAGYLTKGSEAAVLCSAVRDIARGRTVVDPDLQGAVLSEIGRHETTTLSERELATVQLVAAGLKERDIAARLHVSPSSVKSYLRRAYEKLGASDRASVVAEAARRGLIS